MLASTEGTLRAKPAGARGMCQGSPDLCQAGCLLTKQLEQGDGEHLDFVTFLIAVKKESDVKKCLGALDTAIWVTPRAVGTAAP